MIGKIKSLVRENRENQKRILLQAQEIEWAQVYHDSIRGKKFLINLQLNVGRWAGNYSFFYILNRVLMDYQPKSILEFGLGESSKFISSYLDNCLIESKHIIIEQDENWAKSFINRFTLSERSEIKIFPLEQIQIEAHISNVYSKLNEVIKKPFDLYVVDGPFGSDRYSRYDIVGQVKNLSKKNEFIIIVDDYERQGEKDTMLEVFKVLQCKNIDYYTKCYSGNKTQLLIATKKYKFAASL